MNPEDKKIIRDVYFYEGSMLKGNGKRFVERRRTDEDASSASGGCMLTTRYKH